MKKPIEELTKSDIKYNKIWTSKDKFIFRLGTKNNPVGPHWYLKKTLVIWKYFLIDRKKISKESYVEIAGMFQNFIDLIPEPNIKQAAEEYFFNPIDFRKSEAIIDFEKFNDGKNDEEMNARKLFIAYLMGIGGQSGLKKYVMKELFSDQNITLTKIQKAVPMKQEECKKKGERINGLEDSVGTTLADCHAEIRNYRQLLSYRGITPQEEEGQVFNEISKLCCNADSTLIMAIWEHQKIKWRIDNPWIRPLRSDNPEEKYMEYDDFQDFKINNYVGLILILDELYQKGGKDAYISFEDYKLIISRAVPFEIKTIIQDIEHFRKLSRKEKETVNRNFNERPKTREFTKDKPKNASEDFYKEVNNLIYGISGYRFNSNCYNTLLKYDDGKLSIVETELFEIFAEYIKNVKLFIERKYEKLYDGIARYVSLKQIDEIFEESNTNEHYKTKLQKIRKKFQGEGRDELKAFYNKTLREWNKYLTSIDDKLLIYTYAMVLVLNNFNSIKNEESLTKFISEQISKDLVKIIGTEKADLIEILEKVVSNILHKQSFVEITYKKSSEYEDDEEKWLSEELEQKSIAVVLQQLKKIDSDLQYELTVDGKRQRKRNTKMMRLVQKQRMEEKIIVNKKRYNFPIKNCDVCDNEFGEKEPQCHHMIPFEMHGPDDPLNYAFLCKKCHDIFTHNDFSKKAKDAIDQLKLKNLANQKNYKEMIKCNIISNEQILYLHHAGYIHTVQFLELNKMWNLQQDLSLQPEPKKTMPSGERWNRAMYGVYLSRKLYHLIMEREIETWDVDTCDGCDNKFRKGEPECHHIIPKKQKFLGKSPEGPESPYNYAYLCEKCHQMFTYGKQERIRVVEQLKDKGLVSKETIKKMILQDGLNNFQLDYLKAEKYIDENEHKELSSLIMQMENYLK